MSPVSLKGNTSGVWGQLFAVQDFRYIVFLSLSIKCQIASPGHCDNQNTSQSLQVGQLLSQKPLKKRWDGGVRWTREVDSKPKSQKQQNAFPGNTRI